MEQNLYYEDSPGDSERPLSRFLEDDNIRIMEHFIPYCGAPLGKLLALQVKMMEMQKIIHDFEGPQLKACGLENDNRDIETILRTLKSSVSPEKSGQIDSLLQIFQFGRMYQRFSQITREHPELLRMMTGDRQSSTGMTDAFSDPSLFVMLNSLLNGSDGDSKDRMKNVLDLAMNGGSENMDMTNMNALLATLINRQ